MNDRALRYFLAVVRTGSIRGAAEALHVAPSAVSRQVAEMEAACGSPLLERLARGVVPTEAGRAVAEHAQRQVDEAALLEDRLRRLRGVEAGTVRLCCGAGFLPDLMENGLAPFARAHPGITVRVDLAPTDGILAAVAENAADLGLAYNPATHPALRSLVVSRQPIVAVVPTTHSIVGRTEAADLRDFAGEPVTLLPPDHGVRRLLARVEADGGFRLCPQLETASFEMQRRFVAAGLGAAFLPGFAVAGDVAADHLAVARLADPLLCEAMAHLVVRSDRRLPEAVARMADWLTGQLVALRPVSLR